jgi:hypothetical protein
MLKKLLIPAFVFTVAAIGCSSSSNTTKDGGAGSTGAAGSTAGTTGAAGSTAGTTGAAGSTAGTTGAAGSTAGTTGTAGAAGSAAGAGGSAAGAGGSAAGAGGSTAGHDGGAAGSAGGTTGTDGGAAGNNGNDGGGVPACTSTSATSEAMPAAKFCTILLADCGATHVGYTTQAECEATYTALGVAKPTTQKCTSYHLCNAAGSTGGDRTTHCGHATAPGTNPCP